MPHGKQAQPWTEHPAASATAREEVVIRLPTHLFRKEGDELVLRLKLVLEDSSKSPLRENLDERSLW